MMIIYYHTGETHVLILTFQCLDLDATRGLFAV